MQFVGSGGGAPDRRRHRALISNPPPSLLPRRSHGHESHDHLGVNHRLCLRRGLPVQEGAGADDGEHEGDPLEDCVGHKDNVHVFIDFGIKDRFKDDLIGRVEFELFTNKLPLTCENFRCFITGEKGDGATGKPMHYKGVKFHRIIPGFMLQGGDHIQGDGSGGMKSISVACFDDEWPDGGHVKHSQAGLLSMANSGPGTNGSQFFVTFAKARWLDGRHVVLGRVVKGMEHAPWIEILGVLLHRDTGQPLQNVIARDCGQLKSKSQ